MKRFGISTHLFHSERLQPDHLVAIADHGFEAVELFATKSHFNYHDLRMIDELAGWLRDTGLEMPSVHAPIVDSLVDDRWGRPFSTATRDAAAWQMTMTEMHRALEIARRLPFRYFVLHLGLPAAQNPGPEDNNRDVVLRSIEAIYRIAEPLGVKLALEVMGNHLSTADALVNMIENDLEGMELGICMDVGHAFLLGDPADAIETASGYLLTTHLHDNHRRHDDHLVPFQGDVDWAGALIAFEKIGYDGVLMFEVKNADAPARVLDRATRARKRLEDLARGSQLEAGSF